jgi:hypothetical protein
MKKLGILLCTTAMAVTALSSADARTLTQQNRTLANKGYWRTYLTVSDKGSVCGMETLGSNSGLYIKAQPDTHGLWVHLFKTGWKFPADGTAVDVPLTLMLDGQRDKSLETTASGTMRENDKGVRDLALVEFNISGETAAQFLDDFGHADRLTVTFKEGNETPWTAKLDGSETAATALRKCAASFPTFTADPSVEPTQPYSQQSTTQPYSTEVKKQNTI